jgi:NADH:ubiquinone oxidoreductase subunit E
MNQGRSHEKMCCRIICSFFIKAYSASMLIRSGQFGMKFENKTGDKEFEITNIKPIANCSTSYVTIFGNLSVDTNTKELKAVHYPESLHVVTAGLSYVQLNIFWTRPT